VSTVGHVTNYILTLGIENEGPDLVLQLNRLLVRQVPVMPALQQRIGFVAVDRHAGGYKAIEARVLLYAGSYHSSAKVEEAMRQVSWPSPETVQLFVMEDGADRFEEHVWSCPPCIQERPKCPKDPSHTVLTIRRPGSDQHYWTCLVCHENLGPAPNPGTDEFETQTLGKT
jgi:hypothetical protein